ncbi:MAG TPA: hypothetical protein VE737_01920 [Actinomycetota bacterium]|nr:hypothetical protein [Actinomycetota bacterium]
MMVRPSLILALVLVATACGQRAEEPAASPPPEATPTPTETEAEGLPGATCRMVDGGNPANFPDFVEVEVESADGVDAITFRFEPQPDAPARPPPHFVYFTEKLITEGEGRPVHVEGEAFVVVSFQAVGHDLSGETPVEVYTGPERFDPGFPTLREAAMLGDFEGQVSWGLGLSDKVCYRIDAGPDHLTVEFPSA